MRRILFDASLRRSTFNYSSGSPVGLFTSGCWLLRACLRTFALLPVPLSNSPDLTARVPQRTDRRVELRNTTAEVEDARSSLCDWLTSNVFQTTIPVSIQLHLSRRSPSTMAPTARISGGESLSSPMRITYDSSSSDEETSGKASRFMSSLKGPKKFLNDRKTARKASSTTNLAKEANTANSRTSSFANRSRIFVESISNASPSQTSNAEARQSNSWDLQSPTRSIPERGQFLKRSKKSTESHPHPIQDSPDFRTLTLRIRSESQEQIQTKPMIPRQEPIGNREAVKIPKRKRSRYHGNEASESSEVLNQESSHQARRHRSESRLKRAVRASPAAEAAVMEWIESVDPNIERRKSEAGQSEVAEQPSPAKVSWSTT